MRWFQPEGSDGDFSMTGLQSDRTKSDIIGPIKSRGVSGAMKVTIEIDCTPEEARVFMGLPDVKPMQEAVMAKVERQMLEGIEAVAPDSMMKTWMGAMPPGAEQMRDAFMGLLKTGFTAPRG